MRPPHLGVSPNMIVLDVVVTELQTARVLGVYLDTFFRSPAALHVAFAS
jgi:hypothetical protein